MSKKSGINKLIGSGILAILCYIVFLGNIEKIAKINSIIIPGLILFILFVGIKNLFKVSMEKIGINTEINTNFVWIWHAVLYASYNLILLIPVLINLKKFIKSKKQIKVVSITTGVLICVISILIFLLLINVDVNFKKLEMPIVYVIKNNFNKMNYIYGMIILIAIFTTAISVGISFLNNIAKSKKSFPHIAAIMCISSVAISNIGFSNLVRVLFPMFGYLGLVQIYFISRNKNAG